MSAKEWTKTYPNDTEIIALPNCLSKLEEKNLVLQKSKEEETTKPRPAPTLKEETPKIVMLSDLKILNPGV